MKTCFKLYMMLFVVFAINGCTKSEDNDVSPSNAERNWFLVEDLPGKYNELRYELYRDYGITFLSNDTLGQEIRGYDNYGEPIIYTALYRCLYNIYSVTDVYSYAYCRDSSLLIKAMQMIKDKVCPYLPDDHLYRPTVVFLADTLYWYGNISGQGALDFYATAMAGDSYCGIPVGRLAILKDKPLEDPEWDYTAGLILAFNIRKWIGERFEDEMEEWYDLTAKENNLTLYDKGKFEGNGYATLFWCGIVPEEIGFLRWDMEGFCISGYYGERYCQRTPGRVNDLIEYIATCYRYRKNLEDFYTKYKDYPIVVAKMKMLMPMIQEYEQLMNVKLF